MSQIDLGQVQAHVSVGTVTTGEAGTDASVVNSGTSQNAVLDFTIPRGAKGDTGNTGPVGPQGPMGPSGYSGAAEDLEVVQVSGNSDTAVMSQKAVTDEINVNETIDISNLSTGAFYLMNNKWYEGNLTTGAYIVHLGVLQGEVYRIASKADKATRLFFLSEFYPVKNTAATYTTQVIPANTTADVTIPNGCYFLVLQDESQLSGGAVALPQSVNLVKRINNVVEEHSTNLNDILFPYKTISQYGNADCVAGEILKVNGTTSNNASWMTSNFITIPDGATHITYNGVYLNNHEVYCGIMIADANQKALWFDPTNAIELSGVISLDDYPNAKYVRYCVYQGHVSLVKIVKKEAVDIGVINGQDNLLNYGCALTTHDSTGYSTTRWCSFNNPCEERGVLYNVYGNFQSGGNIRLYIGSIDQNDYLIIRDSFLVAVTSGVSNVDVSARNIIVRQGEYIFFDPADGTINPYFGVDSTFIPKAMTMSSEGTIVIRQDGVVWDLGWSINTHTPSYNELVKEASDMQDEIDTNAVNIANLQNNRKYYIEDSATGMTYLLGVRNGAINLVPMQFSKALVLGNSITKHGIKADIWWGQWGMAATKPEYDFVHVIEEGLKVKDANAECVGVNIAAWEQDFTTNLATLIGDALTASTDLVVIRLGENVPSGNVSSFQSALRNLVDYIYSISPNAKVVITTMYWANTSKDAAIAGASSTKGIDLIPISQFATSAYEESVGHYVYGADDAIHEITNNGVAKHPSNVGMAAIANAILTAIGYERVEKTYSLQEVTVGGVTGTMWVEVE